MSSDPNSNQPLPVRNSAEPVGTIPTRAEPFGTVPKDSEAVGSVPNPSASFRTIPKAAERTASHTLTVREVARMFETAGVSRTERSIVKWCLPNKHDVARLDAFFDENERRWFITRESVDRAIAEEQARAAQRHEPLPNSAEPVRNDSEEEIPKHSEARSSREASHDDTGEVTELNAKLRDLEIATRVKDVVIKKLETDLTNANEERQGYIQQLIDKSRLIGSLETQLLQLDAPHHPTPEQLPNGSEPNSAG